MRMKRFAALLITLCLIAGCSMAGADDELDTILSKFSIRKGPSSEKKIALTMDDGFELEYVWKTVELCKQYNVHMTFFPLGYLLSEKDQDNWQALIDAGCEIGCHNWKHFSIAEASAWTVIACLGKCQQTLDSILGYHYQLRWFRPPYGGLSASDGSTTKAISTCKAFGYEHVILWSESQTDPKTALQKAENGGIMLFHARHKDYVCLETLIPALLEEGYQLVTVSELLGFEPIQPEPELYVYNKADYPKNKK